MINTIHTENNLSTMRRMEDNSVDSIVADPPAGIEFMGKEWDKDKGGRDKWIAWMTKTASSCLRVLKPGGHALIWAIPRTSHWTAMAWENAGFEVRDCIYHVFGTGFPKSLNVSKQIDKVAGKEREVIGVSSAEEAQLWDGWGTALKPAAECWWLLRKPLSEKTVVANVLKWGTGAINIDGCRVEKQIGDRTEYGVNGIERSNNNNVYGKQSGKIEFDGKQGRFPANFIHDGSQLVLDLFPNSKSTGGKGKASGLIDNEGIYGKFSGENKGSHAGGLGDSGSAARFFYCAKTNKNDRNEGLDEFFWKRDKKMPSGYVRIRQEEWELLPSDKRAQGNIHPTVKSTPVMRYLCKLITPPNGVIYDPFGGSGSTGKGAVLEGFNYIISDLIKDYCDIAEARIKYVLT